jgi:hypothetical protein
MRKKIGEDPNSNHTKKIALKFVIKKLARDEYRSSSSSSIV